MLSCKFNKQKVSAIFCTVIFCYMFFMNCESNTSDKQSYSTLVINEFMISNQKKNADTVIVDEDSSAADWVELCNAGSEATQLYEIGLSDRGKEILFISVIDSLIPPGGHYLLWGGNSSISPLNHLGFSFSRDASKNEMICLFDSTGLLIDKIEYSKIPDALVTNKSYGRVPDGGKQWKQLKRPTPGNPDK